MFVSTICAALCVSAHAAEAIDGDNPWSSIVTEAQAPASQRSDLQMALATEEFDRGRRQVSTSVALMGAGFALGGAGVVVGAVGFVAGFGGIDTVAIPLLAAGAVGIVGGTGMIVASPFVLSSGLRRERNALAMLHVEADKKNARLARTTGIGGAALGLIFAPAAIGGVACGFGFSLAQQQENERVLASVHLSPELYMDGGGVKLGGSF